MIYKKIVLLFLGTDYVIFDIIKYLLLKFQIFFVVIVAENNR